MAEVVGTVLVQPRRLAAGPQVPLSFYPPFFNRKGWTPSSYFLVMKFFPSTEMNLHGHYYSTYQPNYDYFMHIYIFKGRKVKMRLTNRHQNQIVKNVLYCLDTGNSILSFLLHP